jgi:hypothetical protein
VHYLRHIRKKCPTLMKGQFKAVAPQQTHPYRDIVTHRAAG